MLKAWLRQAGARCKGGLGHYYLKCCIDRLLAVRVVDHGTISWWPTDCPAYKHWYALLYPASHHRMRLTDQQQFIILCVIYRRMKLVRTTVTFSDALAQTCWAMKTEKSGVRI